ncbi:heterotrimeric G-protein alpha subunit, GPA3-like protein [Coprinopsis sp. MPI-PUGE-AT-0042]|nr:heterotrimeric G-protein alpha subunit, GPA3-like protein [Coprinopsis sp. MPI-PUGE-AT-0042]
MGKRVSVVLMDQKAAKARSDEIDKQIEEDSRRFRVLKECKVLLMGTKQSGKSTVFKQVKIFHQGGLSEADLIAYRPVVYKNVMESACQVLNYMTKAGLNCVNYSNRALADKILDVHVIALSDTHSYFSLEIAEAIDQLWKDPIIPKIMDELYGQLDLMENAGYFLGQVLRIGQPDYLPNEMDVLRAHEQSASISETKFMTGQLARIHMIDLGSQRSERRKWIHHFESVTSIIYCAALGDYDQVLREEKSQNRMSESLILWESMINSRWFLRTGFILFLTKIDLFKNKLHKVPLEHYFPEYTGGMDINKAAKYFLWKFMQANRARVNVYPHLAQLTDTNHIRLVFAAVRETVLANALRDAGRI